ncbi:MAG: phosphoribosylanthranilate isomerase [Syntrophales bacterium]|nr:phosphoribosylanthranilate isomerase [Syntrophales bacterium]
MTAIKICGITRIEDAMEAVECGVQSLGFIFHKGSTRCISPETALAIMNEVPSCVAKTGVFVNEELSKVKEIVSFCRLDMIQLHGDEPPEYARAFSERMIIKAFSPRNDNDVRRALLYPARLILVDSRDPVRYGGTGMRSNWKAAAMIASMRPLLLAGGLDEDNIDEAIREVRPAGVDLNSGVESAPGIKDCLKMRAVVDLVRKYSVGPSFALHPKMAEGNDQAWKLPASSRASAGSGPDKPGS